MANGNTLTEVKAYKGTFYYEFSIGDNYFLVQQIGKEYELKINGKKFSNLQEKETDKKSIKYGITDAEKDPYKLKKYDEKLSKTSAHQGFGASRSKHLGRQINDTLDDRPLGHQKSKDVYNPYKAEYSIINKYRNPTLKQSSTDSESNNKPAQRSKPKKKNQNLNDSWEKAWEEEQGIDPDQFSTYKPPKNEPNKLIEEDNFNFDYMKQTLPEKKVTFQDENDSDDSDAKNYEYDFNKFDYNEEEKPQRESLNLNEVVKKKEQNQTNDFFNEISDIYGAPSNDQPNYSQNPVHQTQNQYDHNPQNLSGMNQVPNPSDYQTTEDIDFFKNPNATLNANIAQTQEKSGIDDLFGSSEPPQAPQNQPPQQPMEQPKQTPQNLFASSPEDVFNTNPGPMMGGFNTAQNYGMYNQGYDMGGQNFGMQPNQYNSKYAYGLHVPNQTYSELQHRVW